MPSPPRPLRHSPPRKPLHDRSDSSTNERASPTLRIIGDPQATIYTSTPFPTHPSHILSPKTTRPSGAVLEEVGVSDEHNSTLFSGHVSENDPAEHARTASVKEKETDDVIDADTGSGPQPWPHRTSQHVSPTLNFSPEKERDFDANGRSFIMDQGIDEDLPLEEIVQLPSVGSRPNALSSRSFSSSQKSYQQPVLAKSSDASLSSAESTGTVIRTKPEDRSSRASYSFFPSPTRHEDYRANSSSGPPSIPANPSLNTTRFETSPVSPVSPESPAFSHIPSTTSHRAVSIPRSDVQGNVSVQYPVVRPPTTSGSWAQSSEPSTTHPPQRNPNRSRWWKPHLSTVESVGMTDRSSGSQFFAGSSQVSRDSTGAPNSRSESPPLPAFPRSAYPPRRDITNSTIRVVTEQDDHVGSTLAPVPGSRGSTRFSIFSGSSKGENRRSGPQHSARPSSKGSFFRDSIPAWARYVYPQFWGIYDRLGRAIAGGLLQQVKDLVMAVHSVVVVI